jgi:hypothetical protein
MFKVKGTTILKRIDYLRSISSPEQQLEVIDRLDPKFKELVVNRSLMASNWYPTSWIIEFLDSLHAVIGPSDPDVIYNSGYYIAQKSLTGIYRAFLLLGSPSLIVNRVHLIWGHLFDQGRAEGLMLSKNSAQLNVYDFPETCLTFALSLSGWCAGALDLYKINNLKSNIDCCSVDENPSIILSSTWKNK